MARTKQTARRSTGGMAPRRQMSSHYASSYSSESNPFAGSPQVSIFEKTGKRTIVVEGTAEFSEVPDVVHLSFLITETGDTLEGGIQKVLSKIAQVREIAVMSCGLPNENISSDSIGSKAKKVEEGYYEKSKKTSGGDYDSDDEVFRLLETKIHYEVRSVVRIFLEGAETVESTFSKLCYNILSKAGLRTHEAPSYELSQITNLRNTARTEACENAKSKADSILQALGDETIQLGPPISLTDLFVNLSDDAEDSFLGNWSSWETSRELIPSDAGGNDKEKIKDEGSSKRKTGDIEEEPLLKKAKNQDDATTAAPLDESVIQSIFVVPSIRIAARIQAVFEIVKVEEGSPSNAATGEKKDT